MENKKRNNLIMLACLVCVVGLYFFSTWNDDRASGKGFTSEPVAYENISFELIGSDYVEDKHTFHLKVKNTGNNPVNPSSVFAIENGEKRFSSNNINYSSSKLNPGIEGTVDITFAMNLEDLTTGEPKLIIDRGLITKDIKEIKLQK